MPVAFLEHFGLDSEVRWFLIRAQRKEVLQQAHSKLLILLCRARNGSDSSLIHRELSKLQKWLDRVPSPTTA